MYGIIFDIKKFAIHDGPGIRTTVFLKGCPLSCIWCHNPESQEIAREISFIPEKCIGCGYCLKACPHHCHSITDGGHIYNRDECVRCGLCAEECYAESLEVIGRKITVDEVMKEVEKDRPFYETSGGGITVSGGEPMAQFDFTFQLLKKAKEKGLHTCLDTCGYAPLERYTRIMEYVDIFLYDFKESDSAKHKEYTGVPNQKIISNLFELDNAGATTVLRCPLIPGINDRDAHLKNIGRIASELKNVIKVDVHPYHPLGSSKSLRINKKYLIEGLKFPSEEQIRGWIEKIKKYTTVPVSKN